MIHNKRYVTTRFLAIHSSRKWYLSLPRFSTIVNTTIASRRRVLSQEKPGSLGWISVSKQFSSFQNAEEIQLQSDIIIPDTGKPYTSVVGRDGQEKRCEIQPSYPSKPKAIQNLVKGLKELIANSEHNVVSVSRFGTDYWYLDETGRAIHRHLVLQSSEEVEKIKESINEASSAVNHHPHICLEGTKLTITCATHNPPGLSVKDVKLAKMINGFVKSTTLSDTADAGETQETVLADRRKAQEHNMLAIIRAQQDCGCDH